MQNLWTRNELAALLVGMGLGLFSAEFSGGCQSLPVALKWSPGATFLIAAILHRKRRPESDSLPQAE
jgi:hypothetical protein